MERKEYNRPMLVLPDDPAQRAANRAANHEEDVMIDRKVSRPVAREIIRAEARHRAVECGVVPGGRLTTLVATGRVFQRPLAHVFGNRATRVGRMW